jgi:outer membrane protein assembly factor BamB
VSTHGRERRAERLAGGLAGLATSAVAVLLLSWWLGHGPPERLRERLPVPGPGSLSGTASPAENTPVVDIRGKFASLRPPPTPTEGLWPCFRGADRDAIAKESVPLSGRWDRGGPPVLWSIDLGEGHAGAAVRNGRVYILDYLEKEESDALRCFSLRDGTEIWRRWYRTGAKRNHGISRTVPAVSDRYVVSVGPRCHVLCVDAATGEFRWGIDLVREWGTREPLWFTAQCPLIDGPLAILAPAGKALMIAVECATGRVVWQAPNPRGWQMSHASVVPMTVAGRKMYVYCAEGGIAGVAADGKEAGTILWETTEWNHSVVAPTPVVLEDGRLFVTAGYGAGSALLQVVAEGGRFSVATRARFETQRFACEQQTPVYYRGHLFGVLPKDAGAGREQLACMEPGGQVRWRSGKEKRFGLGPFVVADGKIFTLSEDGVLSAVRADPSGYHPLGEARVLNGKDAWAPLAVAGGRLLLRDSKRMVCLDLAAAKSGGTPPEGSHGR